MKIVMKLGNSKDINLLLTLLSRRTVKSSDDENGYAVYVKIALEKRVKT